MTPEIIKKKSSSLLFHLLFITCHHVAVSFSTNKHSGKKKWHLQSSPNISQPVKTPLGLLKSHIRLNRRAMIRSGSYCGSNQISTETNVSLFGVRVFPLQMLFGTKAIRDQHHYRPLLHPPKFGSYLHTVSRFLLSTAAFLPGPCLRKGCVPMHGDAIRAWWPVLVLRSRVGPAATVTPEEP